MRAFFSFLFPGGFLLLAAVLLFDVGLRADWVPEFVRIAPYAVFGTGIFLGWLFNRSRSVHAILTLGLAERCLHLLGQAGGEATYSLMVVRAAAATLLPLDLALFAALKDRGLLSLQGLLRLCFLLAQPLALAWLMLTGRADLLAGFRHVFWPLALWQRVVLPQPALLAFGLALAAVLALRLLRKGPIADGFFWAVLASMLAFVRPGALLAVYLTTAGCILLASIFKTSYGLAFIDDLTGLPGRRAMKETLQRLGGRYAVAIVDVDHFKRFNDRHGHEVGDQVLRMVASRLAAAGGGAKAFRYGGEEFSLIYAGRNLDEVMPHLEVVRRVIASSGFYLRGNNRPRVKPERPKHTSGPGRKLRVTASIGVAERNARHPTPTAVLKAADKAMYRAKRKGRNRVVA